MTVPAGTVASRLLASIRLGHKIIGGVFRLAVYGKVLQGEAELMEQHDRERCVSLGSFYRLADGIAKDTGMPIEEVDKLIQDLSRVANPNDPDSLQGTLQAFGLLNSDPQRLITFLSSQATMDDQKKVLVTTLLIGRGDYLDPDTQDWVKLEPATWSVDDTRKMPADLINELQQFLIDEKAAMTAGGKPPAPKTAPKPRGRKNSSAATSTAPA
jgi:hypothetical protein